MKSQSKRFLSLALALTLVLCMMPTFSASAVNIPGGAVLYLKPNSNWKVDNARFAAYFFNNSTNKNAWVSMTDSNGDGIYQAIAPDGDWGGVIFCRMNPSTTANNWNNKWNQTSDLTYDDTNNMYTVANGAWDKGSGTWSFYHECYTVAGVAELCGTGWDPSNTGNDMTLQNGVYSKTFQNVPAGTYSFKIVADRSWKHAWPSTDQAFTVAYSAANVTITFNTSNRTVSIAQSCAHGGVTETQDTATCVNNGLKITVCKECKTDGQDTVISSESSPATGRHTYDSNGTCSGCGATCSHNYAGGTCSVCGQKCSHVSHNTSGICSTCGLTVNHSYKAGTCSVCGLICAHADHNTDGSCKDCGVTVSHSYANGVCSVCGHERADAALIGTKEYASLSEALAAAQAGDTIVLQKAAEVPSVMLMNNISLDLNGCTLTTGYMAAYPGSTVIDSTGGGLLKVAKNRLMLQKNNGYLPIWNGDDGYTLVACKKLNAKEANKTEDSVTFKFLATLDADAYALLAAGAETSGVQLKVEVSWDKGDGTIGSTIFTYTDTLLAQFYDNYDPQTGKFGRAFELYLSGIADKELSYNVYFESETGVVLLCQAAA